jgi:predicted ArsR family transcriptional regulator
MEQETAIKMKPSKTSQVIHVLSEGPATTGEVAAELGWTPHLACAHLKNLHLSGRICRERFPTSDRRVRFLWAIAEKDLQSPARREML